MYEEKTELIDIVFNLLTLNDENLAQMVIDRNDVQWCLSELYDILKAEENSK